MSGSDEKDEWTPACHHQLCCALGDFAFHELEKFCGADKALELSLVVAAVTIGAYAHAKRESIDTVGEAVRLLARTFDAQVKGHEREQGEPS